MTPPDCAKVPWHRPWRGDDFDPCFRALVVERGAPAAAAAVSAAILAAGLLRWRRRARPAAPSAAGSARRSGGAIGSSAGRALSVRDGVLVVLTATQAGLACALLAGRVRGAMTGHEAALWLWAVGLCAYLLGRSSVHAPSPSPHLRFVYAAGLAVDGAKMRTALLAYSRGSLDRLPAPEIAMAAGAFVLFAASFTQQRRRHGLPPGLPPEASRAHPPPPELTASIAQLLLFSWMDPMIWLGYRRPLEPNDVYDLMPEDRSEHVCARWQSECRAYARRRGRDTRSLARRLFWFFRWQLAVQCAWTLAQAVFVFSSPLFLRRILAYMEDPTLYTREQAFWCVFGLLAGASLASLCQSQALWVGRKIGIQIKSIIVGDVYAKSLRRRDAASTIGHAPAAAAASDDSSDYPKPAPASSAGDDGDAMSSFGKITNLMAVDANKISEVSAYLHLLYLLPVEIAIAVVMLYQLLGAASIGGLATILVLVPVQWWIISVWNAYQDQLMKASDRRMSAMNEILQGVRIIKFFAWEPQFERQVAEVRGNELGVLRRRYLVMTYSILLFFMAPVFVTLTTFAVYTALMGHKLTASVAFTALALFKTLRSPMDQLPDMISYCLQALVSVNRVQAFLDEEETPKYALADSSRRAHDALLAGPKDATYADVAGATDIGFIDASFSWGPAPGAPRDAPTETDPLLSTPSPCDAAAAAAAPAGSGPSGGFELRNLTVSFPVGKLSIIAGPTGSGKSSMVMALLGEMLLTGGQVMIPGAALGSGGEEEGGAAFAPRESVAYVAQQAWLLNDTIRGNITFGLPYDKARYSEVVRMCALSRDLEILAAGDLTEVGERGVALSGGQKQRISLARAVYSPARHIVMDDCLSAVDAHTAKHLYENCLMAPAMAGRTRILVTHSVALTIRGAAMVVVMNAGRIAVAGTPAEVLKSGQLGEDVLHEADGAPEGDDSHPAGKGKATDQGVVDLAAGDRRDSVVRAAEAPSPSPPSPPPPPPPPPPQAQALAPAAGDGKLTTDEEWSRGHVSWRVYYKYITASGGVAVWAGLGALFVVGQGLQVAQDWWLREWAASYSSGGGGGDTTAYYIGMYGVIAVLCVVVIFGRSLAQFWSSVRASRVLHEELLHTVLRAPVRFFDTTPVGRLVNRFSKDMETIDQALSSSLAIFVTELVASAAILVVITAITPAFAAGAVAIACVYWAIGVLYLSASREIKRFESVTKSPIYTQFGETLSGVSTIRAYGQEARFRRANYAKIDDNIRPFIYMWGANRWLSIRVDLAGATVSFAAGLLALLATGRMDAGLAGLSLTYALNFTEHILWVVRFYSVNEMNLNSVERVVEYLDVEPEAPVTVAGCAPPAGWPSAGRISVEGLELRYAPGLPPVIRGVTFQVRAGEKVGIVGRTGAGKSTLTLAMLRIMEASAGRIVVDGVDISRIGVGDLRSRVTIIPQDPVLFTGTVRSNLDPFGAHGDDELWLALRRAHLLGDEDEAAAAAAMAAAGGSSATLAATPPPPPVAAAAAAAAAPAPAAGRAISGLEMAVAEGGSNFSQGQRQLIALARALVKHTRVIILDEATASVDFDTDARIQATIRSGFAESTLLCIAHRLRTIVDYDRVLVLDQGEVVEFDTPHALLQSKDGLFRHMCLRSGEYDHLLAAAERKHRSEAPV
ncbi:Transporter of the ATP-binding cassette (ABC) [Coemansia javaensis]|uniref:Transporter of the ATP-binding cassette (ABC) n=1 Tax=Coemansia javaensis TaxID=2761396 RepID=A0A9W8HG85_9FUNG|nr:Transporter of the ATP-binding cassette (ABC) [Coemansia javaensis]